MIVASITDPPRMIHLYTVELHGGEPKLVKLPNTNAPEPEELQDIAG